MFLGLGFVLYYVFQDLPDFNTVAAVAPIERFPLYFGTVLFALEAVGVVIALENNMEQPKSFGGTCGVLNIGMTIVTAMYFLIKTYVAKIICNSLPRYAFVGFFGYWKYGKNSKDSITLDMPRDGL